MDNTSQTGRRVQRIAARAVPTLLLAAVFVWTLIGPNGMRDLFTLRSHADEARDRWANLEKENTRLLLDLQRLQADPINLERLAADQLGLVRPGTTLYAFDERDGAAAIVPATAAVVAPVRPSDATAPTAPSANARHGAPPDAAPAVEPAD